MDRRTVQFTCCLLALALLAAGLAPAAEAGSFLTARKTFGILFLGGSAVMTKKAVDFHRDANRVYDAYKLARTAKEADLLFQRSSDRDTKSQMSIGVSVVLLVSGLRLLMFSGVDDNIPKIDRRLKLDVTGDARTQALRVAVKRKF